MQIDNELCENNDEKLLLEEINCILPFPLLLSIIIKPFPQVPFWERNAANKNSAETGGNLQRSRVELSLIDYQWNLVRWGSLMPSPLLSPHTCGSCYYHATLFLFEYIVCKWEVHSTQCRGNPTQQELRILLERTYKTCTDVGHFLAAMDMKNPKRKKNHTSIQDSTLQKEGSCIVHEISELYILV